VKIGLDCAAGLVAKFEKFKTLFDGFPYLYCLTFDMKFRWDIRVTGGKLSLAGLFVRFGHEGKYGIHSVDAVLAGKLVLPNFDPLALIQFVLSGAVGAAGFVANVAAGAAITAGAALGAGAAIVVGGATAAVNAGAQVAVNTGGGLLGFGLGVLDAGLNVASAVVGTGVAVAAGAAGVAAGAAAGVAGAAVGIAAGAGFSLAAAIGAAGGLAGNVAIGLAGAAGGAFSWLWGAGASFLGGLFGALNLQLPFGGASFSFSIDIPKIDAHCAVSAGVGAAVNFLTGIAFSAGGLALSFGGGALAAMIGFFTNLFKAAGGLALAGASALFDLFGKLSGSILLPAIHGLGDLLSISGKITLGAIDGLFNFNPCDFFVNLGTFGALAIGDFFAGIKAGAMSLVTGFFDLDDVLIQIGRLPIPQIILGQIKQLINLFVNLPGLSIIADTVALSFNFAIGGELKIPDIRVRFGANGEFGIQSLFDILKGNLTLDNFDPVAMIKAALPGAKQFLFEGIDTFLPAFEDFTINPLDLSFMGNFFADCEGIAFIKAKLHAGLEHAINFAINGINAVKSAGMLAFHAAEGTFHIAQKAFFLAQQAVWDICAKRKKIIAGITAGVELALHTAKAAVDTAIGALNLAIKDRDFLKLAFDAADGEVKRIDKEIKVLYDGMEWYNKALTLPAIAALKIGLTAAKVALAAAKAPFIAAELAVNVAKAALAEARKKYNELPSLHVVLEGTKNAAAAAAETALNFALKAYETGKAKLAAINLKISGFDAEIADLQLQLNPYNQKFLGAVILELKGKRAIQISLQVQVNIDVNGLLLAVNNAKAALKVAAEAGASAIGNVALAGLSIAEGAAKAALAAAELALAVPKAAFDLALGVWNGLKAAVELGLQFTADVLAGLAGLVLTGIQGAISVTGGKQEMHLSAQLHFFGVKYMLKVDIDFAEIGHFVEKLVAAVLSVIYEKINGFGVSLKFEASLSIGCH